MLSQSLLQLQLIELYESGDHVDKAAEKYQQVNELAPGLASSFKDMSVVLMNRLEQRLWNENALPVHQTVEAKKNKGIFFLSTPDSYHSVSKQLNTKSPRKFIYGSYSYRDGDVFRKRNK